MPVADARTYLADIVEQLKKHWPGNRAVHIVCHGHSVPAGYFATPMVDTFNAYPHLLHKGLKDRFPFAVINVIVTAIGGEHSVSGAERFERDVLGHRPDVTAIDYGLNDRGLGLARAEASWRAMIEKSLDRQIKLILLTPTPDTSGLSDPSAERWLLLQQHAEQIRRLAAEYGVGLVDSLVAFEGYAQQPGDLTDLLSWSNHPNRRGHEIVATEILRWFAIT
ncbi:MAG: SGNH/GDSL hydrolase family protein [Candidatus Latescibacteria bacterium]|nr:SGNH/GDSL hydrolase family protein [Candidatus Latescibacterota bacterium]